MEMSLSTSNFPLSLSIKIISLLRYGDQWTAKKSDTVAGAGNNILKRQMHQSNLRPASVLSVAGQLIRTLEFLVTVDVSFIRYPRQTLLTENIKRQGDTLPSSRVEEVQPINGADTQRSGPLPLNIEVKDTVAIKLAKCCSMILRSSIELLETPYDELKEAESKVCNSNTSDKDKDKGKEELQHLAMMPVHFATAYMLRSSLISVSKNNNMSSIQTETKELLLNFRAADADGVVKQVLYLIEKICSNSPDMIEAFTDCAGGLQGSVKCSSDLMDSLSAMPPRYFRDDRYRTQLLPVLTTLFMGRKNELDILLQEQLDK